MTFTDVPEDHTFHDDIDWIADRGITKGINPPDNDRYGPDFDVTRGQMAAFLHRAYDVGQEDTGSKLAVLQAGIDSLQAQVDDLTAEFVGHSHEPTGVVSVDRGVVYADAAHGDDTNDGYSLFSAKRTLQGVFDAASDGDEVRLFGNFREPPVEVRDKWGLRVVGHGGISRNRKLGTRITNIHDDAIALRFLNPGPATGTEGPEFANVNFIDESPNGVQSLLRIDNINRWRITRCSFVGQDTGIGLKYTAESSGDGDNSWNTIDGETSFTHMGTGIDSIWDDITGHGYGAGLQVFGAEFTACEDWSININGQNNKFEAIMVDGGGIQIRGNHNMFAQPKFEAMLTPDGRHAVVIKGGDGSWSSPGNHNIIRDASFAGYGRVDGPHDAFVWIQNGCRFTVVEGCAKIGGQPLVRDDGFKSQIRNPQDP